MLFGSGIKANTHHGKRILDFLGFGIHPHHPRNIIFGKSYKEGKGLFDKLKNIANLIPKDLANAGTNLLIDKVVPD